jgi:cytidylate kinase
MYRALTWWCRHTEVDLGDADAIITAALGLPLEIGDDPQAPTVAIDGTDVAAAIRTSEISSLVSTVATVPEVRVEMQRRQRALIDDIAARHGACVAEGRDVTTVIAPDAQVRILLTASEEARLRRRSLEVHGATDEAAIAATRDQVVRRDRDDSTVSQFTEAAEGVTVVDTSDLDFEGSVAAVMDVVAAARAS